MEYTVWETNTINFGDSSGFELFLCIPYKWFGTTSVMMASLRRLHSKYVLISFYCLLGKFNQMSSNKVPVLDKGTYCYLRCSPDKKVQMLPHNTHFLPTIFINFLEVCKHLEDVSMDFCKHNITTIFWVTWFEKLQDCKKK